MSGVGFSELIILALIGLIVLGPERLPRVASQIGNWIGQARRMTRVMRRQLEDEINFDEDLNPIKKATPVTPHDDDSYSPLHTDADDALVDAAADIAPASIDETAETVESAESAKPAVAQDEAADGENKETPA